MFSYPIKAEFHADAVPQAVWDAITGVERWAEVLPGVGAARIDPPGRLEAGATIRSLTGPQDSPVILFYRVTMAEPPHFLTLESESEAWRGRTDYTIEPDGSGSKVSVVSTMEVTGALLRLQMLVVGKAMNKQREDALRERTRLLLTLAEQIA